MSGHLWYGKGSQLWAGSQLRKRMSRVPGQSLIPLGDGPYMRAHAHTGTHATPHMSLYTHAHFYHLHELHTLRTAAVYTSLVHVPGVRHKQMTCLHHVYTPAPHLHTASLFPPALSQHRLSQTGAHTAMFPAHTLTPSRSHPLCSTMGSFSHPLLPELGAKRGGFKRRDGNQHTDARMECSGPSQPSQN